MRHRTQTPCWHRRTWQLASLLLTYPDAEQAARLPAVRLVVPQLPRAAREPLQRFLAGFAAMRPPEREAAYVRTFDHRRRGCLDLTYYPFGDTRKRGLALLRFKQAYRAAGVRLTDEELPDHLAVVLEFAATADAETGRRLLEEYRVSVEAIRLALLADGSPYVGVLEAVCATLRPLDGDGQQALRRLAAQGPPAEEVGLEPFGPLAPLAAMGAGAGATRDGARR